MTTDDGKAPPPSPARPLARWALATLALDAALIIGLARVPRAIVTESSVTTRAPVTQAIVTHSHAVFLRQSQGSRALVVVPATGPARQLAFDWDGVGDVRCAMLARVEPSARCPAPDARPMREARAWIAWRAGATRWEPAVTTVHESIGDAPGGDRSVRVTVDALNVQARVGYLVERPWVSVANERARIEVDAKLERAVLVRSERGEPRFIATPDGFRLALDERIAQRRRGILATLAGQLGETTFVAMAAWLVAQIVALAAARAADSSLSGPFARRFLRWSAMLATFVTGALALGALRLAQG
ncbi:MAG: hypothetical protein U0269_32115 [Polyangiales bacterium]